MNLYKRVIYPILSTLGPERAHSVAMWVLRHSSIVRLLWGSHPLSRYPASIWCSASSRDRNGGVVHRLRMASPVGIAAGFDKNALMLDSLSLLGAGHIEVGTATLWPNEGHSSPTLKYSDQDGILNRMGLPNDGIETIARRVREFQDSKNNDRFYPVVGLSVGIASPVDFDPFLVSSLVREARSSRADYIVLNLSCPAIPLVSFSYSHICAVLSRAKLACNNIPLLVKIGKNSTILASPRRAAESVMETGLDGLVIGNSIGGQHRWWALSGTKTNYAYAREGVIDARKAFLFHGGEEKIILACGGVSSPEDVVGLIRCGADAVQVYSAIINNGPSIIKTINTGVASKMDERASRSKGAYRSLNHIKNESLLNG